MKYYRPAMNLESANSQHFYDELKAMGCEFIESASDVICRTSLSPDEIKLFMNLDDQDVREISAKDIESQTPEIKNFFASANQSSRQPFKR